VVVLQRGGGLVENHCAGGYLKGGHLNGSYLNDSHLNGSRGIRRNTTLKRQRLLREGPDGLLRQGLG
jgi:hypothetical protein